MAKNRNKKDKNKKSNLSKKERRDIRRTKRLMEKKPYLFPKRGLEGEDLMSFANKIVNLQTRPQLREAKKTRDFLRGEMHRQVGESRRLGRQVAGNIGGYYRSLAEAEAENLARQKALSDRLQASTATSGAGLAQNLSAGGTEALDRLSSDAALRKQGPSSARDQLVAMVASQKAHGAREQAALSAQAASQGEGFAALQQAMAGANQMQGATARSDALRNMFSNVQEIRGKYRPEITDARRQIHDIRAGKGDMRASALLDLIGREREFSLSKGALNVDRASLKAGGDVQTAEDWAKLARVKGKQHRKSIKLQGDVSEDVSKAKSKHWKNMMGGGAGKNGEFSATQKRGARSFIKHEYKPKHLRSITNKQLDKLANAVRVEHGIDPKLFKQTWKKLARKHKRKKTSRDLGASGTSFFDVFGPG